MSLGGEIENPFTDERVDDRFNNFFIAGNFLTGTYNDISNTYTLDFDGLALDDVSDVTITSIINGNLLYYSSGWKNLANPLSPSETFLSNTNGSLIWSSHNPLYITAYHSTTQATTGSFADVLFDTELSKAGITHSTTTNNYEFTIETDGVYQINFQTSFVWGGVGTTGGVVEANLNLDTGSGYSVIGGSLSRDQVLNSTGSSGSLTITINKIFLVGDKIKAQVKDTGDSVNLQGSMTRMSITRLKI